MCELCNRPCHTDIKPSSVTRLLATIFNDVEQYRYVWFWRYENGVFYYLENDYE